MQKEKIILEIDDLINEGYEEILTTKFNNAHIALNPCNFVDRDVYNAWRTKIISFLKIFLEEDSEFILTIKDAEYNFYSNASICINTLKNVKEYLQKGYISLKEETKVETDSILETIFSRFHRVARQLRSRHNNRGTLEIEDEYDVQDLVHALLQLFFDDIRNEEWTPSYAGQCARVDFLLKNEKIVIEIKKTRKGLSDKEIGNQLIEDIDRYKAHPDCERLICFVYDPMGYIVNPNGLKTDLNKHHQGFVTVIIEPDM